MSIIIFGSCDAAKKDYPIELTHNLFIGVVRKSDLYKYLASFRYHITNHRYSEGTTTANFGLACKRLAKSHGVCCKSHVI